MKNKFDWNILITFMDMQIENIRLEKKTKYKILRFMNVLYSILPIRIIFI